MNVTDLKEILKDSNSLEVLKIIDSLKNTKELILKEISDKKIDDCWINSSKCPYGNPEGKIMYAPIKFCGECQIFLNLTETESFSRLFDDMINSEVDTLRMQDEEKAKNANEFLEYLIEESEKEEKIKLTLRDFLKVLNNHLGLEKIVILAVEDLDE